MKRVLEKKAALEEIIFEMGGALVAYSGGVDSTFFGQAGPGPVGRQVFSRFGKF